MEISVENIIKFLDPLFVRYFVCRFNYIHNEQRVYTENGITYIPIYYIMFFQNDSNVVEQFLD